MARWLASPGNTVGAVWSSPVTRRQSGESSENVEVLWPCPPSLVCPQIDPSTHDPPRYFNCGASCHHDPLEG